MMRLLDPSDRISEILFGLIMVLTFTGSLSVAQAGREDVHAMLIGALGCNLAWGIIDGIFYLMGCISEKGSNLKLFKAVRQETDSAKAREMVSGALPLPVAKVLDTKDLDTIRERLRQLPDPPGKARLGPDEWLGAVAVFLLVFLTTFPVALPFIFIEDIFPAMRWSNVIAVVMMFGLGCAFGKVSGGRPLLTGVAMVLLGTLLVGLTILLGG